MEDEINWGNVGNGMPRNRNVPRSGADPPKNVSGSAGTDVSNDLRRKLFKVGRGCFIAVASFSNAEPLIPLIKICDMRSWRSAPAIMFSTLSSSATPYQQNIMMGKGGQISSDLLVGLLWE